MKNRRALLAVFVLLALAGGMAGIFFAGNPASPVANVPATKTTEAHKLIPASASAIETPKAAPAKPGDTPPALPGENSPTSPSAAAPASTGRDVMAERKAHHELVEQKLQAVVSAEEEKIKNAPSDEERQKDKAALEELKIIYQARLDLLALPPPAPLDFGDVSLVDGMVSPAMVEDTNESYTLMPMLGTDGNWKMKVTLLGSQHDPIYEVVPITPGKPKVIQEDNDLEIHFTPRLVPPAVAPNSTSAAK